MKITGKDLYDLTKEALLESGEEEIIEMVAPSETFEKLGEQEQQVLNNIAEKINRAFIYGSTK